jgi:ribonuclease HII
MTDAVVKVPRPPSRAIRPTLAWESALWDNGSTLVAGVDEVGRGPLAGPVFAGAVILPALFLGSALARVRDSKIVPSPEREELDTRIRGSAAAIGIGGSSVAEIDRLGIVRATHRAMRRALLNLGVRPDHVLIDALRLPRLPIPQTPIVHGDGLCLSIACASIVAKVARDRVMSGLDRQYPGYGFAQNKGYATREHLAALQREGPSAVHRCSFAPVRVAAMEEWFMPEGQADGRRALGAAGESLTARFLEARGYRVLERNVRTARGEIDLVAEHDGCLVFIEVRLRRGALAGDALESVTVAKQRRLRRLAGEYCVERGRALVAMRIDVVAISLDRQGRLRDIQLVQNAVEGDGSF